MAKEPYSRTRVVSEQEEPRVGERHCTNPKTTEAQELPFGAATGMFCMLTANTGHKEGIQF